MNSVARIDPKMDAPSTVPSILAGDSGPKISSGAAARPLAWDYPFRLLTQGFVASAKAAAVTVLSGLAILFTCGVTLFIGLPQMNLGGHDILTFMDGGWRVLLGQRPSIDFYSALGPVYYFLWAGGFKLAHDRVEGIVYATALAGVILGFWSFAVARKRFGALCAVLCTTFLLCILLSPFVIGDPPSLTTYGEQYNRIGYVLLLILFIELFGAKDQDSRRDAVWEGLSSGVALGLLLFLKANFFTVALVPLAFAYAFRVKGRRHFLLVLAGFLAVSSPIALYLHGHLGSYLTDLRIAAGARTTQKGVLARSLAQILVSNAVSIVAVGALALIAQAMPRRESEKNFICLDRPVAFLLLVLGCDFVLALSNSQGSGLLLSVILILLLADQLVRRMSADERQGQWAFVGCLFVVAITAALPHMTGLASAWETELLGKFRGVPGYRIDAPQIAAMRFKDHSNEIWGPSWDNGHLMTDRINAGIALLKEHTNPEERIACVCFTNPFSYALLRQPPRGGSPFFDYGFNISEAFAPSAERILGNADVVMIPKREDGEGGALTIATLMRICEPILSTKYMFVAESEQWVLLRRRA